MSKKTEVVGKILLTGGNGLLGKALKKAMQGRFLFYAPDRKQVDWSDAQSVAEWRKINHVKPGEISAVIHCAAACYNNFDEKGKPETVARMWRDNVMSAFVLSSFCYTMKINKVIRIGTIEEQQPSNEYNWSKKTAGLILSENFYTGHIGWIVNVLINNLYGSDMKRGSLLRYVSEAVERGQLSSEGQSFKRRFLHTDDAAAVIVTELEALIKQNPPYVHGGVFTMACTGNHAYSAQATCKIVAKFTGLKMTTIHIKNPGSNPYDGLFGLANIMYRKKSRSLSEGIEELVKIHTGRGFSHV